MMTEIMNFMAENPWLTWALAWSVWPIYFAIEAPFRYAFRAYSRHVRAKNIAAQGWPTNPLMDADGDIVHPKKDGEE